MEFDFGTGTWEDLVRLGAEMDSGLEKALALTERTLKIRNRLGLCVPLAANQAQKQYERKAGRRNIVLKARQMGVTSWIAGQFFLRTILHPGTVTVQVAHEQGAAEQIFRIVHRFLAHLPEPLRTGALKTVRRSARRILFPEIDSEYLVETAADRNAGRGLTIANLHCTELARWPGDAQETLCGLMATLAPTGSLAMESTPMGAAGCFWKEWQEADRTATVRHFFPWWMEEAYVGVPVGQDSLSEGERGLMEEHGLSLKQIGYRRQIRESFRGLAKQEYAEDATECFLTSGECVFEVAAIDERLRSIQEPVELRRNGELRVWLPPLAGHRYLVAVDPAGGGTEGDYTAIQVIEMDGALQCAELRAHLSPLETARLAAELAQEYGQALLVVERNSLGAGVLAYVQSVCGYPRLYESGGQAGFLTSQVTRSKMVGDLGAALVETPRIFSSERLLRECRSFVRLPGGGTGAQAGEHDDCVMAMAMALAVREEQLLNNRRLQ